MELIIVIFFITSYPSNPPPLTSGYLGALSIEGPFGWARENWPFHCPCNKNLEIGNLTI
jgi:hypothetical protein